MAMPMDTGTSPAVPLSTAFWKLLAALPGPAIRSASIPASAATTIRAPA
jgi:hypothetical protein